MRSGLYAAIVEDETDRWRPVCWDNHHHATADEATECARKWIEEHRK